MHCKKQQKRVKETMEMAMISSCVEETSSFLNWLEANMDLDDPMKVTVRTLRIKTSVLNNFFACKGKFQIDDKNLKTLFSQIQALCKDALGELQLLWFDKNQNSSEEEDWSLPKNLESLISTALDKLDLVNPHIKQVYDALSKSSTRPVCSKTDAVIEFIEAFVRNMKELLSCKAQSIVPAEKEIKALMQDLLFLRNFLVFTENWCGTEDEKLKELILHAESVADNTACLFYLCCQDSKRMDEAMVNQIKLQFSCQLQRIESIGPNIRVSYIEALKASKLTGVSNFLVDELFLEFFDSLLENMIEQLKLKSSPMVSEIRLIEALHDEMKILRYFLLDSSAQLYIERLPKLNDLLLHINIVVCEIACVIYSCYDNGITEDMARQLKHAISKHLDDFKLIKEKARVVYDEMIPKSLRSKFPRTDELGFMDFMIQNMKEMLNSKAESIVHLQYQIEAIHGSIVSLKGVFIEIAEQPGEHVELKDLWARFKDIVYHTEYVIDSAIFTDELFWCHKLGLFDAIEEMKHIRRVVDDVKNRSKNNTINHVRLFEDKARNIAEQLTHGSSQVLIVCIVGMPGIGKTTLANLIYENHAFRHYFHVRARCCVTQTYEKRKLFLEILQQISPGTDRGDGISYDVDLAEELWKRLKHRRYLIYLDDLWDISALDDMTRYFPDDRRGSRIMVTTRFHDITSKIGNHVTIPLRQLSDEESLELLKVKLFNKELCPQELFEVSKQIAVQCKGHPLTIDLVVDLLKHTEMREYSWRQLSKTLNEKLLEDQQGWMITHELSYNNLPSHLKPCFLYFGAFLEDEEVPARTLMWLWIAEGFIQLENDEERCLEDVADEYLNDLIARSLVTVSQRRYDGRVKACRVHHSIHEFALAKAKEEFLLQAATSYSNQDAKAKQEFLLQAGTSYSNQDAVPLLTDHPYRLGVHTGRDGQCSIPDSYPQRVRSLLCSRQILSLDSSIFPKIFKLLRVLHLPKAETKYFRNISCMVHLRFLYLWYVSKSIPSEIGNLQNLETCVLRMTVSPEVELPKTIWNLKRLRHFKVDRPYLLPEYYSLGNSLKFDHLQTLSTPLLCHGEDNEKIMRGLPNLRRLSCMFLDSWDDSSKCNHFPTLDFLSRLESLKVTHHSGNALLPCRFNLPHNLKKLTLSNFGLPWTEISMVGKLPKLESLKLLAGAFVGKTWDILEGEFYELKFLKLESLDIEQWNISEYCLPLLETLVVNSCVRLEAIPSCLVEVPTLQRLELHDCSDSARVSAEEIKELQAEIGNQEFILKLSKSSTK